MSRENAGLHGNAPDKSRVALLVLDLLSDFDFEHGAALCEAAWPVARRVAPLLQRARAAGVPCIYANDNVGRWRSDFPAVLRHCLRPRSQGARIARLLQPKPVDYCILKPKHSAFFATTLDTLLRHMEVEELIVTGMTSHQCVLFTAIDAYVRDLRLRVPADCIAAARAADTRLALRMLRSVLNADTGSSTRIEFPPAG